MLLSFEKESHKSCPCPPYNAAFPTTWLVDLLWINLLLLLSSLNPQAIAQGPGAYDFRVTTSMAHVENHHHLWIQKAYVIWLVGTSSIHVESSWNNCSLHKLYHQNPVQHTVTLQSYTTIKSHKSKHPPKKKWIIGRDLLQVRNRIQYPRNLTCLLIPLMHWRDWTTISSCNGPTDW